MLGRIIFDTLLFFGFLMMRGVVIVPIGVVFFCWRLNYLSYSRGFILRDIQFRLILGS